VIPLPVNTSIFFHREGSREKLGWTNGKHHLLFVGRLASENRIELLLECMIKLSSTSSNFHLHIVGDGPLEKKFQVEAQEAGLASKITWHGAVPFEDLPYYYSAADMLVFSRPTGAPPRVVPQAMACGTPVVSVANESVADYVIDGVTGALTKSTSGADLAFTVVQMMKNPSVLAAWRQASIDRVVKCFAIDAITKRIRDEVYKPLLNIGL
jgi:glycosyltransferase involved in cell wall biosynthesis